MRALVLGGHGFLGRSVVAALRANGHAVEVGSRALRRTGSGSRVRRIRFEHRLSADAWLSAIEGVDVVVNCVGILRERGHETYERVHHLAPGALAGACACAGLRLVHVSALGLHPEARSGFIASKLRGEAAVRASGADHTIVRPSLLEGEGGFGARWLRAIAQWPVHCVPADATGRIAVLHVDDAGIAIARVCEMRGCEIREADLGGDERRTLAGHLAALRGWPRARRATARDDRAHRKPRLRPAARVAVLLRPPGAPASRQRPASRRARDASRSRTAAGHGCPRSSVCARSRHPAADASPRWWKYTERASALKARVDSSASNAASGTPRSNSARIARLPAKRGVLRAITAAGASPSSSR